MRRDLIIISAIIFIITIGAYFIDNIYAVTPGSLGLKEGDLIRAADAQDLNIYIINEHGYKRLFLNPIIFSFYGHLGGFSRVKNISAATRDSFATSSFYRNCETNDSKVYSLEITGEDTGILHWLDITAAKALSEDTDFFKKIFCINNNEFFWYQKGSNYNSTSGTSNNFSNPKPSIPPGMSVDLKINGTDNPGQLAWNEKVKASWTSTGAVRCAGFEYMPTVIANVSTSNMPTSGEMEIYNRTTYSADKILAHIICYNINDKFIEDFVEIPVTPSTKPSISVISSSNESYIRDATKEIKWSSTSIIPPTVNIVLTRANPSSIYKADYWYIAKNVPNTGSYSWKVGQISEPITKWGTSTVDNSPGTYAILILNSEENIFGSSQTFRLVLE